MCYMTNAARGRSGSFLDESKKFFAVSLRFAISEPKTHRKEAEPMGDFMKMERRKLSDLRPAEYNPRVPLQPEDKEYQDIKRSIEQNGYLDPIVVNYDGTIIKGHQRRTVMMDLGMEEAEVVVVRIEDKGKEKQANIALNKITGRWDELKLRDLLLDLEINEYDLSATGFTTSELEDLCINLEKDTEAEEDDFDPEKEYESIEDPVTKRGDIWILGRHRLMCGDSTSPSDVAELMAGEEADLIITDPPYNVNYGEKVESLNQYLEASPTGRQDTIANDNMDDASFTAFLQEAMDRAYEIARPGAAVYVFHADSNGLQFRQAFRDAGLKLAECLIWEKNSFVLGRQDYQWRHEPILYGWKEGAAHYFINDRTQDTVLLDDEIDLESMKKQDLITYIHQILDSYKDRTSVLFENKPVKNDIHPTMKPVPLIGRLMKNSSKPGWNVADLFGGGGSTLMAAEQLNRCAYLMELDERFCDVIVHRWEEFTGEKAVLKKDVDLDISI